MGIDNNDRLAELEATIREGVDFKFHWHGQREAVEEAHAALAELVEIARGNAGSLNDVIAAAIWESDHGACGCRACQAASLAASEVPS